MLYGYARISQPTQNIERQIRNLKNSYPGAVIVQETHTGTSTDRPKERDQAYYKEKHSS